MNNLSPLAMAALERARANPAPAPTQRRKWTKDDEQLLTLLFPNTPMRQLVERFQRHERAIYGKAYGLGLKRSEEYLQSEASGRMLKGDGRGGKTRFQKGHCTWNKGLLGWAAGGRAVETQFKAGEKPHSWKPIGSERITKDGYLQRKVTDTGYPPRDWVGVHHLLWIEHHGEIPKGFIVVFKDNNKKNVQIDNLELISRAENIQRNSIHRYPTELKQVFRKLGKLKRTIEDKSNEKPA